MNVGAIDRAMRIIAGIGLIGAGVVFQSWWGALGLVLLVTGLVSRCPAYSLLKINTVSKSREINL